MNVSKIDSRVVKTYTLTIADGEIRTQPYSSTKRQYRVARIVVKKSDGNVSAVELSGPVPKKDGTDSANWATENFYGERDWPQWLRSLVGGLS